MRALGAALHARYEFQLQRQRQTIANVMQALVAESGSRLSEVAQKMGIPSEQVAQLCGMGRAIPEQSEEQSEEN